MRGAWRPFQALNVYVLRDSGVKIAKLTSMNVLVVLVLMVERVMMAKMATLVFVLIISEDKPVSLTPATLIHAQVQEPYVM